MPTWITVESLPQDEHAALSNILDAQRVGLIRKVEDIDDDLARQAPTVSSLSLLGLLKHAALWEARWFQGVVAGETLPDGWPDVDGESDEEFDVGIDDTVADCLTRYRDHCAISRSVTAPRDLAERCARPDIYDCNLRYVMLHMIAETARHAGHADIIRETLDGTRGI